MSWSLTFQSKMVTIHGITMMMKPSEGRLYEDDEGPEASDVEPELDRLPPPLDVNPLAPEQSVAGVVPEAPAPAALGRNTKDF